MSCPVTFLALLFTIFYFEVEEAEDDKQFGVSKENRPLPIVEIGLFMDRDGIPLAFCINPGNENEQQSLIPLEKKLVEKFDMSQFIVCTDADLSSNTNRYFSEETQRAPEKMDVTIDGQSKKVELEQQLKRTLIGKICCSIFSVL